MSLHVECTPGFKDGEALIQALIAVGFDCRQIEIHQQAVLPFSYQGDVRPQRALGRTVERRILEIGEIKVLVGGYPPARRPDRLPCEACNWAACA